MLASADLFQFIEELVQFLDDVNGIFFSLVRNGPLSHIPVRHVKNGRQNRQNQNKSGIYDQVILHTGLTFPIWKLLVSIRSFLMNTTLLSNLSNITTPPALFQSLRWYISP